MISSSLARNAAKHGPIRNGARRIAFLHNGHSSRGLAGGCRRFPSCCRFSGKFEDDCRKRRPASLLHMDVQTLAIQAAVLVAALFQSATGVGFGLIAGPVLLLIMNSASAVQVTMLLSLLIAALLAPSLYGQAEKGLLSRFILGTVVGVPIGVVIYQHSGVGLLRIIAGLVVLFMAVSVSGWLGSSDRRASTRQGNLTDIGTGILSGVLGASLAMPGPPVVARLSALGSAKDAVRATMLALFVVSFGMALPLQGLTVSISPQTMSLTLNLVPAALIGIYLGRKSVAWISERAFRLWEFRLCSG